MRKVKVFQTVQVAGTTKWETVERGTARFHQFGVDYEESDAGFGNYTAAVIEWPDGKVELVRADKVQFLEPAGQDLVGEMCEFSDDGETWSKAVKCTGFTMDCAFPYGTATNAFRYARSAAQV